MRRARAQDGWTALIAAAQFSHANVVTLLLDHGAAIEAKDAVRAEGVRAFNQSCAHCALTPHPLLCAE
jgi:ankyrin repeat protein